MIRKAELKDIPKIHELLDQVNEIHFQGRSDIFKRANKYDDVQLEELLRNDDYVIFVICDEMDDVCGYLFGIVEQNENNQLLQPIKTLYIDDLCIDQTCRNQHYGTQLMDYIKIYAKNEGCYNITLNVWAFNSEAIHFYEKNGFFLQKMKMETRL
ncbi:MAG: GNAT family N-acetyltransferase [Traorella sp.]